MPQGTTGDMLRAYRVQRGSRPQQLQASEPPLARATQAPPTSTGASLMETGRGLVRGAVKGVGQTAFGLGDVIHSTPGIGDLTDLIAKLVGPDGTNPADAFSRSPADLETQGGAETVGKLAEQIGEFFTPIKGASKWRTVPDMTRRAIIGQLVPRLSPSISSRALKTVNIGSRVAGEALPAATISAVHGDENPQIEGSIAGAAPLAGEAGSATIGTLASPLMQQIGPVLAAMMTMKMMGGITPGGLAGGMGAFTLAKQGAKRLLQDPAVLAGADKMIKTGATVGGRVAAGAADQYRLHRRRLEER